MAVYYQRIPLVDKSTTALLASFNYSFMESLILAQDERWRRALYMQVKENLFFGIVVNWRTGE